MYSSRSAADRIEASGLALFWPAMSGALPCTGSPCVARAIGESVSHAIKAAIRDGVNKGTYHEELVTGVDTGHETQRAHKRSGAVGNNVAVKVGCDDDVENVGLAEKSVDHAVYQLLVQRDAGKATGTAGRGSI